MLNPKTTKQSNPPGEVTTRHLEGSIVETVYKGHAGRQLVESVLELTPTVLEEVPKASWLLDMTAITGMDPSARVPGSAIFTRFRELGGNQFAVVLSSGPMRMVMMAVAFATGLPIKVFEHRAEALAYLRSAAR